MSNLSQNVRALCILALQLCYQAAGRKEVSLNVSEWGSKEFRITGMVADT